MELRGTSYGRKLYRTVSRHARGRLKAEQLEGNTQGGTLKGSLLERRSLRMVVRGYGQMPRAVVRCGRERSNSAGRFGKLL